MVLLPQVPKLSALYEGQQQAVEVSGTAPAASLTEAVARNAIRVDMQDYPSCVLRGEEVKAALGLWPEVALIPHSCAPTSHEVLIGDILLVRASVAAKQGEPLSRNHLGMQVFTPLSTRRALLEAKFGDGFRCGCPRCTIEEKHPEVSSAVEAAYETSQKLSEKWVAAHDSSDAAAAAEVRQTIRG